MRKIFFMLAATCFLLAALPAAASAELQTIDFESGPALNTPVEQVGDVTFSKEQGFRPYRTAVGARAHSGSVVGDVGRCVQEGGAGECEFFQAKADARLARSAESVTVFVGRFGPVDGSAQPELAVLNAFNALGAKVASSGFVPIDASGFNTQLSVSRANAKDIVRFEVKATTTGSAGGFEVGGDLGIDDVRVNFASGGAPDFSVFTSNQVVPLVQGQSTDVAVQLPRINGSVGPISLTVTGLPDGVSAVAIPNPVPGVQATATLRLSAAADAPDAKFLPVDATIEADPLGNAEVGAGPRTATLSVRVAADFTLAVDGFTDPFAMPGGRIPIRVPDCAPIDVPVTVSRDIASNDRAITLSLRDGARDASGMPAGISAEILPSPTIAPGGGLVAERTLRLRAAPGANLSRLSRSLVLSATAGAASHELPLEVLRAKPIARVETTRVATPRLGRDGTRIRISGSGFCPGTSFEVGEGSVSATAMALDDHSAEILTPRLATSGSSVFVIPPGSLGRYKADGGLTVDNVRNRDGFQFQNNPFVFLSLSEFTKSFGADDVFLNINPCFPLGDCGVPTGIPDPVATIKRSLINAALVGRRAHCFGISLASQRFKSGKEPLREFAATDASRPASAAFDLDSAGGPPGELNSLLDALHARQSSEEFLSEWFQRPKSLQAQLDALAAEFAKERTPIVSMRDGFFGGHAVLAYDMTQTPTEATIYTYDNELPFLAAENTDPNFHLGRFDQSIIKVDKVQKTWSTRSFQSNGTPLHHGGNDGSLWVVPAKATPDDPSLPGLRTLNQGLEYVFFGSPDGAARAVASPAAEAEFLPTLDASGRADGTWVKGASGQPLDVAFEGIRSGAYSQGYATPGFVASVESVETRAGVRDQVTGAADSIAFASGIARPLEIELARGSGADTTRSATLRTHASAAGSDSAGLSSSGVLTYAHDGAATVASFSLTTITRNAGPATFVSGPIAIARGDRLSAKVLDRQARRVRLTIRGADGKTTERLVRNHARNRGQLKLRAPRVSGRRLSMGFKLAGIRGRAVVGVTLRLLRGKQVVARKAQALKTSSGLRTVSWDLPRAAAGRYRVLADARAIAAGANVSSSVGAHRATTVRLSRH